MSRGEAEAAITAERMEAAARTAGALAHEFANVLGTVRTMTALLKEEVDADGDASSDLDIVAGAVDAGEGLLRELRAFVHPPDLGEGSADLGEVALAVGAEIGAEPGRERAVAVVPHVHPLRVSATAERLGALLARLLRVLLEEMPAGGAVRVTVLPDPDRLSQGWLAVECPGLVRDPGIVARLFEPFAFGRAHHTGLALPGVHAAVTKAGGRVLAEAAPDVGLTIRLGLPLASGESGDAEVRAR